MRICYRIFDIRSGNLPRHIHELAHAGRVAGPVLPDQGSKFVARDLGLLAYAKGVILDFPRPGKATVKAFIEVFNNKLHGMTDILSDRVNTPLGPMVLLARDGVLLMLDFEDAAERVAREMKLRFGALDHQPADDPFGLSFRVKAYFAGDLSAIEGIETDGGGTEFQRRVWAELKRIPRGATISYGGLARRLGDKNLMRAVGLANGRNPISIVVPCHRVIGADGSLTGYGGGIERKKWLLSHEGVETGGRQRELF